jgi:O-antigen/teichoic acid export membrane protein
MQKIISLRYKLQSNTFLHNNALYWVASLGVSFLNYLYYPVLGRILNPTSFGETQTVISFFTQLGAFFQVLSLVGVGIITKYSDDAKRDELTTEISRLTFFMSIVFFVLSILLAPALKNFFHFSSIGPFFLLSVSLLISVPGSFANSYLQGHRQFKSLAKVNIAGALSKLALAVLFVLLGFKAVGAIGGLVAAQLLALLISLRLGRGLRHFISGNLTLKRLNLSLLKQEAPYAVMVLATSLTTNLLLSFDILVVKHYFSPAQAGLYTGISIISNIIYYLTGPFAAVMIPSIKPSNTAIDNQRTLKKSLIISVAVGGSVLALFLLLPHLVVLLLLGHKYAVYASFLRGLAFSMFALSIANLLIYYHIGLRHFLVAPMVLVGLLTTLILLSRRHSTMGFVVLDLVIGSTVILSLMIILTFSYRRSIPWRRQKTL